MIFSFQASDFGLELIKEATTISKMNYKPARWAQTSKVMYIVWYAYNIDTKKKERVRSYSINRYKEETERRAFAKAYIEDLKYWLNQGYSLRTNKKRGKKPLFPKNDFQSFTITQAIDHALEYKFTYVRASTKKNYNSLRKKMFVWLNGNHYSNIMLANFNTSIIYEFLDYIKLTLKRSNKTYNNDVADLHAIFQVFVVRGILNINPCKRITKLPVNSGSHKPFNINQLQDIKTKIIESGDEQLLLFIYFCYFTLARPRSEVRKIKVEDIKENTISFPSAHSKNRKGLHVIIPPDLEELIQKHNLRNYPSHYYIFGPNGIPGVNNVGNNNFYKRHSKVLKKVGLYNSGYTLYGYKHTGVINLFNAGADIKDIQKQCRHSKLQHTDNYLKDLGLIRNDEVFKRFKGF